MQWSTFWTAVGALATVAAALTLLFAARQLRFDAWLRAQEIFVHGKFLTARGRVFRHLQGPDLSWDAEDQEAGLEVCRRMEELCRLAQYFSFTSSGGQKTILEAWDDPLGKSWALLEPLVIAERDVIGWKTKWKAFQELGGAAFNRLSQDKRDSLKVTAARLRPQIDHLRREQQQSSAPVGVA